VRAALLRTSPAPSARSARRGSSSPSRASDEACAPSCNGRHMAQTAAHRVDHVIPPVPVRQWVIALPKRLRGVLGDRPKAVAAVTSMFLHEIETLLGAQQATPPSPRPRLGAVSFLHRFGSGLNRHAHLHAAVTDGVFLPDPRAPPSRRAAGLGETPRRHEKNATPEGEGSRSQEPLSGPGLAREAGATGSRAARQSGDAGGSAIGRTILTKRHAFGSFPREDSPSHIPGPLAFCGR
jgi:hypothetical protein